MECTSNESLQNLSDFCLANPDESTCFPEKLNDLSTATAIWCLFNAFTGIGGNLLTLLAIPYAANKRKFNLHRSWDTNVYILNLAFADFLYCTINLPLYAYTYLAQGWTLGPALCKITAVFRYVNAFADWMGLAIIALSRCFLLTNPHLGKRMFGGHASKFVILCVWICANLILTPLYVPQLGLGTFGYNCRVGKCDFIPFGRVHPRKIIYGVAFFVPCFIVLISYLTIWYKVWSGTKYLKRVGHSHLKKLVAERESRTTWTLFMVSFCYFVFVSPITFINMLDYEADRPDLHVAFHCFYWLQYTLNFFIYAVRSDQFRKAYIFFLKTIWQRPS